MMRSPARGRGSLHRLRLGRLAAGRIIEAVSEKFVQVASLQRVGEQREDVADVMIEISHRAELAEIGLTEQGRIMQIRLEFNVPFVPPAGVRKPIPTLQILAPPSVSRFGARIRIVLSAVTCPE